MYRSATKFDPKSKIWSGVETADIFSNNLTVGHVLLYMMNNNPNKVAQISDDTGVCLTFNDIRIRSIQAAKFFQKIGLKEGDIVGFLTKNSENLTSTILGALTCGTIVNGLYPSFGKDDVTSCFVQTKPKIIFCDDDNYEIIRQFLSETDLKCLVYTVNKKIEGVPHVSEFILEGSDESVDEFEYPLLLNSKNVPAVIMYSSGTTGTPKGICVSHATLIASCYHLEITSEDILFTFSTLNAFTAYWMTMLGLMRGATKIITAEYFSPELLTKIIDKYKISTLFSPPSHMAILLDSMSKQNTDLSSLRLYITGGGLVNQHHVTALKSVLPKIIVNNVYGMTEAGIVAHTTNVEKSGSVGQLAANIKIKIINNNGEPVEAGKYGEVLIHPHNPFLGYYGKPKETKEAYDEEGWVHTGDIGYFDENQDFILVNRMKDMLKSGNRQYFPSEIEDIILEIPEVNQVCVAGVLDAKGNHLPTALVVKKAGKDLSEERILEYTRKHLEDYKQLKGGVFFVDSLPISYAGKYKRDIALTVANKLFNERIQSQGL